jgi:biopolymer transport protein ExbD
MASFRTSRIRGEDNVEINMAPLMDMIFILLIFFLVTTSFVKESGIEVQRPVAQTAETKEKANMVVGINKKGQVYIDNNQVSVSTVRPIMEQYLMETPRGSVVIAADKRSQTDILIQVLDEIRLSGVKDVSIATRKTEE